MAIGPDSSAVRVATTLLTQSTSAPGVSRLVTHNSTNWTNKNVLIFGHTCLTICRQHVTLGTHATGLEIQTHQWLLMADCRDFINSPPAFTRVNE